LEEERVKAVVVDTYAILAMAYGEHCEGQRGARINVHALHRSARVLIASSLNGLVLGDLRRKIARGLHPKHRWVREVG
jgi:hypothetical protein